ncbi:MAG: hypothetical protein IKO42_00040 [Opitutales bacterium]|nr:hypothetical protein [Opitutales bacterium]
MAPAKEREKAFKKDAGFAAFLALYLTVLSLLIPLSLSLCISDIDGLLGIAVIAATCFALAVLLWMLLKAAALCCMRPSQKSKEAAVCLAELSAANPELSEKLKIAQEQLAHRNELAEIFEKRMNSPLLFFMIIFGISLIAAGFVLTLFRVY